MTTGGTKIQQRQQSLSFVALPKATLTENALAYGEAKPTFDEWQEHGKALQQCSGAALWWVGDWFVYGEQQFGEMAYQAVGDYEPETVRGAVWTCSRVLQKNRKAELGFMHHKMVAAMPESEQVKWLGLAVEHQLTTRELSASIKAGRIVRQPEIDAQKLIGPALVDVELVFHNPQWQRFVKQQWPERDRIDMAEKLRWLAVLREPVEMYETLKREVEA